MIMKTFFCDIKHYIILSDKDHYNKTRELIDNIISYEKSKIFCRIISYWSFFYLSKYFTQAIKNTDFKIETDTAKAIKISKSK